MRSIEGLREEIDRLKGSARFFKWMSILNAAGALFLGISMLSLAVAGWAMVSSMFFLACWSGDASRIKRMEEEIEERSWE
jgi:hypothetical protein